MIFRSPFSDVTIPEIPYHSFILQHTPAWQDRPAFIDGPSGRTLTFRQVAEGARLVASGLAKRGFQKGDVFAIFSPNLPEYAIAFHGILMLGGIVSGANPLYTAGELAFQLNDTGAKYLLTAPPFIEKALEAARQSRVEEVFVFGEADGATAFASLLQSDGHLPDVRIAPRKDLAMLPYSSGTAGRPKGVMLTHYNLVAVTRQVENLVRFSESDRTLGVLPFYHVYGLVVVMNPSLYRGATCVTMPRFDLEQFLQIVQNYRLTHLCLVPPMVLALAKHPLVDKYDLSSVKRITSGAAPLDASIQKACAERIGCQLLQGYGMTETSVATHVTPDDPAKIKLGSVGLTIPNMESKIVDIVTGMELGPKEHGEIWARGPNIMQGYLNKPEATAQTIDKDGWLHTGDIGYADEDGYFYIVDRIKELIKYKGLQVAPAELEAVLLSHPAIADAAVIPSPDEEAGEVPKAFVVPRLPFTAEEMMAFVAGRVAPHKKIRRLEIVDAIPKSPSGKILRRLLVERERERLQKSAA